MCVVMATMFFAVVAETSANDDTLTTQKLLDGKVKAVSVRQVALDGTTVGKTGHVVMPQKVSPAMSFRFQSFPSSEPRPQVIEKMNNDHRVQIRTQASKAAKERSSKDKQRNFEKEQVRKLKRQKGLHHAAKWKRILAACDFWFSEGNLRKDVFLRQILVKNDGWIPVKQLSTFPKLQHWTDAELLVNAFNSTGGTKYILMVPYQKADPIYAKAMVRRVGINERLYNIANEAERPVYEDYAGENVNDDYYDYYYEGDADHKQATTKPKYAHLRKYSTDRKILVAKSINDLQNMCRQLVLSLSKQSMISGEHDKYYLGFDVEYASLEEDIRLLPAMLQVATHDLTLLVWLDKLPNHGRDVWAKREDYKPLLDLLEDPSVVKVGSNVKNDFKQLAMWWAMDTNEVGDTSFVDLQQRHGYLGSLQELSAQILERYLPKQKSQSGKISKRGRTQSFKSHWRSPILSEAMKEYAAHDASCALDIWMQMSHNLPDATC